MLVRSRVGQLCRRLWTDVDGVTSLEYAIICAVIVLATATAMASIGPTVLNEYTRINNAVQP